MIKLAAAIYFPLYVQLQKRGILNKVLVSGFLPFYSFFALGFLALFFFVLKTVEKLYDMVRLWLKMIHSFKLDLLRSLITLFVYWLVLTLLSSLTLLILGSGLVMLTSVFVLYTPLVMLLYFAFWTIKQKFYPTPSKPGSSQ